MTKARASDPIDIHVGERLRARRNALNITQGQVAAQAGISYQQLQKYENATNRISASRLYELACILKVSPGWFFEGYGDSAAFDDDDVAPPPRSWILLWHRLSELPPELHKAYVEFTRTLTRSAPAFPGERSRHERF